MRLYAGIISLTVMSTVLQGCGGATGGGDPGARPLPAGESCQSIRGELNKLDSRGVPALIERASAGGKLNASQKAQADRYNDLLNQYLGARCHV
jgi:hypothetical protein